MINYRLSITWKLFPALCLTILGIFCLFHVSQAYEIQDLEGTAVRGDIVFGPAKVELYLEPGQKAIQVVTITNRTGRTIDFAVQIEDFKGSRDTEEVVVLMGEKRGPYSLRDWLKPDLPEFTLEHGQRMILPIGVEIPPDAEPGGRYGAVFAATSPTRLEGGPRRRASSQITIVSRTGILFFVRVAGRVNEDGRLVDFQAGNPKNFFQKGPIPLELLFENNGNVHLMPFGEIRIRNILGKEVGRIELPAWFVMPDSLRARIVKWDRPWLFGRYTAEAKIDRGYENVEIIDEAQAIFWVIPWKQTLGGFIGLILIILFFRWIGRTFKIEIRRKDAKIRESEENREITPKI